MNLIDLFIPQDSLLRKINAVIKDKIVINIISCKKILANPNKFVYSTNLYIKTVRIENVIGIYLLILLFIN
jgi:hypothetical protein